MWSSANYKIIHFNINQTKFTLILLLYNNNFNSMLFMQFCN